MIPSRETRLLVCVGPGGVGKTTVAAALAVRAASEGRRVFLLTIDPARRLADALSISLEDEASEVRVDGPGRLDAAMLDTRASWDAFVARVAHDDETRARIQHNRVYQAFSRTLARSHAYVAMERLHHVLAARDADGRARWDLVVLDTPPTRSALDVLDAPSSLTRFVDERVVGALLGGGAPGAAVAKRVLGWIMGERLAGELATFLATFAPLRAGFAARASEVHAQLIARSTSFALVAAPLAAHLGDAAFLAGDLARRGIALDVLVVNRAFHVAPDGRAREGELDESHALAVLASAPGGSAREARLVLDEARRTERRAQSEDARAGVAARELARETRAARTITLPRLPREPVTPAALRALLDAARDLSADAAAVR
ncbi:ArsA family ATPase [Sandaracinus amylolyticus]|uniref:arsenite-transporting ATPase n=1 Tax=Sandaracinus amylolyticus TaxID=927083 RepID=A0A0F6W3D5_9BACT|nr:ArsA-related P-loop ATPase [Sandaracinus amylolyticus]AKF06252.1 Arsenical pump-driving ATPase [Sandaracinus amylolyticus]